MSHGKRHSRASHRGHMGSGYEGASRWQPASSRKPSPRFWRPASMADTPNTA